MLHHHPDRSNGPRFRRALGITAAATLAACCGWAAVAADPAPAAAAAAPPAAEVPVEPDMHEFMEYVFEPGYKRVKVAMAAAPADAKGWKPIKGEALALAEACNLLLHRVPQDDGAKWTASAVGARDAGKAFYAAAKKKDFPAAQAAYGAMLKHCNACHTDFADGKHQLVP